MSLDALEILSLWTPFGVASAPSGAGAGGGGWLDPVGPWLNTAWPIFTPDPIHRGHPLNQGRVALWLPITPLDGGARLYDLAGTNSGTLHGGLSWVGTESGPALAGFAGGAGSSTTYVDCGNSAALNPTGGMTISAWIRTTKASFATSGTWAISRDDDALGRAYALGVIDDVSGNLTLQINGAATIKTGDWTTLGPGGTSLDNTWVHLIATGSPAAGWRLWCNATLIGTAAWTAPSVTTGPTNLGRRTYSGFNGGLTGQIRSASLWSYGLSDAGAMAEYRSSAMGYPGVLNRVRAAIAGSAAITGRLGLLGPGLCGSNPLLSFGGLVA